MELHYSLSGFAFLENSIISAAIYSNKHLHTCNNILIANLALVDVFYSLIEPFDYYIKYVNPHMGFYTCAFFKCFRGSVSCFSFMLFASVSTDLFFAIRWPFQYSVHANFSLALKITGLCLIPATIIGFIPMMGYGELKESYNNTCTFVAVIPMSYVVYIDFLLIWLFQVIMITSMWIYIALVVKRHEKAIKYKTVGPRSYKKPKKLKMLLSAIAVRFMLLLPLYILNIIDFFYVDKPWSQDLYHQLEYWFVLLKNITPVIHPFIYASNKHIRDSTIVMVTFGKYGDVHRTNSTIYSKSSQINEYTASESRCGNCMIKTLNDTDPINSQLDEIIIRLDNVTSINEKSSKTKDLKINKSKIEIKLKQSVKKLTSATRTCVDSPVSKDLENSDQLEQNANKLLSLDRSAPRASFNRTSMTTLVDLSTSGTPH